MVFRADEEKKRRHEEALNYLVPREGTPESKEKARSTVRDLIDKYGPTIDSYPTWHPIVFKNPRLQWPPNRPEQIYKGLEHTVLFAHGFITCPYKGAENVIEDIYNIEANSECPYDTKVSIVAERLDISLYNINTETILVYCNWHVPLPLDRTIPKNIAVPLMLEREVPCWRFAGCSESWERMRRDFLGVPHGSRSSLFVSQETGQAMKNIWNAIMNTGMYGPIKV